MSDRPVSELTGDDVWTPEKATRLRERGYIDRIASLERRLAEALALPTEVEAERALKVYGDQPATMSDMRAFLLALTDYNASRRSK